jgi:hypothetical protein
VKGLVAIEAWANVSIPQETGPRGNFDDGTVDQLAQDFPAAARHLGQSLAIHPGHCHQDNDCAGNELHHRSLLSGRGDRTRGH